MTALIIGATSEIAVALAKQLSLFGYNLQLASRDTNALKTLAKDIEIRKGVSITLHEFDALNFDQHHFFYENLLVKPDLVILVFGYLGNHSKAIEDWNESERILNTNFIGAVSVLNVIANDFEIRRTGIIVGISSVAGERGRMSNYIYGSAKAGLTAYLSGLRNRLFHSGVHVLTVKPGFVRTKMTEGLVLPMPVTADPEQVAKKIYTAIKKRKNVIYILPIWRVIIVVIVNMPETIFKKLKL